MTSNSATQRVISLIDMDCFYVQCEQRLQPDQWGKPCAVAQYNNWKGGGLIAVNYEARPYGVKRGMRGDDASKICPELHIFSVPERNGKADLTRYREASAEVFNTITEYIGEIEEKLNDSNLIVLERASVDEAYIDWTMYINKMPLMLPDLDDLNAFSTKLQFANLSLAEWLSNLNEQPNEQQMRLLNGALLTGELRARIFEKTKFKCSAGISHNKMLSKLACKENKPNGQTILPLEGVPTYFQSVDIIDVRSLGGKLGHQLKEKYAITTMAQLNAIDESILAKDFGNKLSSWLHEFSAGYDCEPVTNRRLSKSIGCGKNFRGKSALTKLSDIQHWVKVLCEELYDRLDNDRQCNKRFAKLLVVGFYTQNGGHCSRSVSLEPTLDGGYPPPDKMMVDIIKAVFLKHHIVDPIGNLSLAATKFVEQTNSENSAKINDFFQKRDLFESSHTKVPSKVVTAKQTEPNTAAATVQPAQSLTKSKSSAKNNKEDIRGYFYEEDPSEGLQKESTNKESHYTVADLMAVKKSFFFRKIMQINHVTEDDFDMEVERMRQRESDLSPEQLEQWIWQQENNNAQGRTQKDDHMSESDSD